MNVQKGRYYIKENSLLYNYPSPKKEQKLTIKAFYKNIIWIFVIDPSVFYLDGTSHKVRNPRFILFKIKNSLPVRPFFRYIEYTPLPYSVTSAGLCIEEIQEKKN